MLSIYAIQLQLSNNFNLTAADVRFLKNLLNIPKMVMINATLGRFVAKVRSYIRGITLSRKKFF